MKKHFLTLFAVCTAALLSAGCVTDAEYYGYAPPVNIHANAYQEAYREYNVVPYLPYGYNTYNYGMYGGGPWASPRPWGGRPWAGTRYENFRAQQFYHRGNPSCRR